jgi:hydroxyethylthiazole kinase-like uncharacterized protein yjeF
LRAGADLAIVVAPRRAADIVARHSADLITVPSRLPYPDPKLVKEFSVNADALVIGCGVARTTESHNALRSIIHEFNGPVVADAEALHAIAEDKATRLGKRVLLTPNAGEIRLLCGKPWPVSLKERARVVRSLARRYECTVIVKGAIDIISDGNRVTSDREGSPYLTKGGYGDLLAGAAAAFLARGTTPYEAARKAAYLVGKAGRLASRKFGEGTLASDTLTMMARLTLHA